MSGKVENKLSTADNTVFVGSYASLNLPAADFTNTGDVMRNALKYSCKGVRDV